MGGALRGGTARAKRLIKAGLRAIGPSPELLVELEALRTQVQATSDRTDELAGRLDALFADFASVRTLRDQLSSAGGVPPAQLGNNVAGLLDRVHVHEQELQEIRRDLERFGGSVLDGMAVERRLQTIEERIQR